MNHDLIHTVQQDVFGVGCSPCFPDLGHKWSCWPMVANGAKCNIQVVRDPTIFVLERSRIQRSTAPKTDTRSPSCSLHAGAVAMNCLSVVASTHSKNKNSDHPGIIPFRMEKSTKQFEKTSRNAASWNFVHLSPKYWKDQAPAGVHAHQRGCILYTSSRLFGPTICFRLSKQLQFTALRDRSKTTWDETSKGTENNGRPEICTKVYNHQS